MGLDPADPNRLYLAKGGSPWDAVVLVSTDAAATWTLATFGMPGVVFARSVGIDSSGAPYIGTSEGVFELQPVCPDGAPDVGEVCDDGGSGSATCDPDCTLPLCGDGIENTLAGEQCDDGNLVDGDGCESTCISTWAFYTGRTLLVKDKLGDASKRKLVVVSKDSTITTPAAGSAGDPLDNGAVLRLANPVTAESVAFILPAGAFDGTTGWKRLGTNPDAKNGYKYLDRDFSNGPCKVVIAKPGGLKASGLPKPGRVRAVCLSKDLGTKPQVAIDFTLDEDPQGDLTVTLQLGTDPKYCMSFGGTLIKDQDVNETATGTGVYKRKDSAAPGSPCPVPP
jgi:cysteine-rich repeat protein